ncbi:hypothetical protein [Actinoplanes sp. NPDC049118]|uniref:hypothetical protein n=1 Tax=Actinoplanes sp. NPDC049118 TaxID=3155769 RepID=UPI0033D716AB
MLAALAVASLSACSNDDKPVATPVVTAPSPSQSQQTPEEPETTQILARLIGRTGAWQAILGEASDQGDLTIHFRCTGGGNLTVGTSHGGSAKNVCDGDTKIFAESIDVPSGPVTVTVEPDDDQRWWLYVARGPVEPGGEWPTDAPEIQTEG